MQTDSIVITFTETNFRREVLESPQPVFVEFFAAWCGTCHINAPVIREMAEKFHEQIKFCQVDMDTYKDIAKTYGVQKIPTMFFFQDSQIVDYMVGIVPRTVITQKLEALLFNVKEMMR
ncbi:MAG: thioredoxin fold domain-containing protein [bacterium]|nr:thioredoxin fold domain-containing protein [bacterium]